MQTGQEAYHEKLDQFLEVMLVKGNKIGKN